MTDAPDFVEHAGPRNLRIIVIDDSNVEYEDAYANLDVVECGQALHRVGSWQGLISWMINDGVPDFDLLLYDISFEDDLTLCPTDSDQDDRRSGGVGSLGMDLALAVMAGRRGVNGMPVAQSGFTAYREAVVRDRHAVHVYGLLRALEGEPPAGVEPEMIALGGVDEVVEGIRKDLSRLKVKHASYFQDDLSVIMPSYRKNFLAACEESIVLDDAHLCETIATLRQINQSGKRGAEIERALDKIALHVYHSDGEENLRLRSFFAEQENLTATDLFPTGGDQVDFDYEPLWMLGGGIDHAQIGLGDFLGLLRIATQGRAIYPIVLEIIQTLEIEVGSDPDNESLFVSVLDDVLEKHVAANPRYKVSKHRVALGAVFLTWLERRHFHARNHSITKWPIDEIRASLGANVQLPRRYLEPIGYRGGFGRAIEKLVSRRLPPDMRDAGDRYWRELNKRFPQSKPIAPPTCLQNTAL